MKKVFVSLVTGAQGAKIAEQFLASGYNVSSVSRSETNLEGIDVLQTEYSDTHKVSKAMQDCEAIVLTLPLLFDRQEIEQLTKDIVSAAKLAGVEKIIYNTSIPLGEKKTGYVAIDVKHDALAILNKSGLEIITLMPTIYLDNLAAPFLKPIIREQNIIPYPVAMNNEFRWVSLENLARYCLGALERNDIVGKKILITNKEEITKEDLAKLIGKSKNQDVHYIAAPIDDFEANLAPILGNEVAFEIANLYRGVEENKADFVNYTELDFINSVDLETTQEWVKTHQW